MRSVRVYVWVCLAVSVPAVATGQGRQANPGDAARELERARALVARAASGDEVAFDQIVAAHHDDMARVSFIVCRDVQLAQEAASAAWSIAWRKLSTVRDPATGWLLGGADPRRNGYAVGW